MQVEMDMTGSCLQVTEDQVVRHTVRPLYLTSTTSTVYIYATDDNNLK